jgi:hypothetical protein
LLIVVVSKKKGVAVTRRRALLPVVAALVLLCLACGGVPQSATTTTPKKAAPAPVVDAQPKRDPALPDGKPTRPGLDRVEEQPELRPKPDQKPEPEAAEQPPIPCANWPTLFSDFRDNPVAADRKYQGKQVSVADWTGQVEKRGERYWLLGAVGFRSMEDQTPVYAVECELSDKGAKQYADLKPGESDKLKLVGTVKGTRPYPNNPFGGIMVTMQDGHFVTK